MLAVLITSRAGYSLSTIQHGAHILNKTGGRFAKSLASPTVVGPVTKDMKLWSEEQFGPVAPIAVYKDIEEPLRWVANSNYGLQSAVFGYDPSLLARVVDALAMHEGRVNINAPDKVCFDPATIKVHRAYQYVVARPGRASIHREEEQRPRNDERQGSAEAFRHPDDCSNDYKRRSQSHRCSKSDRRREEQVLQQ
jgi:hypothetical protein